MADPKTYYFNLPEGARPKVDPIYLSRFAGTPPPRWVISDAFHTFSAVGGVLLAFIAARPARRPATLDRTFGHYRAENFN